MAKSLETWKKSVFGKTIDLDNQSYDCVDVPKSWVEYLSDKPWTQSAGWGNAKDIYSFWSSTYLDRIPVGNAPKLGDIVVMNGQIGGGYGHTGVVVAVNGNNITIYQQNTFTQQPVYTGVFNGYVSYITGYLRPKVPFTVEENVALAGYQRNTVGDVVNYRDAASRSGNILQKFEPNTTYDFKGFVKGEAVNGNNIWFVGRYTGGYAWSGGFTDTGTHDLPDLTPTQLLGYQRMVGNSVINYRTTPTLMPNNVIKTFNPSEVLDFNGWTKGTVVDGSDVWFRGKYTGGWAHSGGFTDKDTHDLPEITLEPDAPEVTPVYPAPTKDSEVTKVYNKKHPIGKDYYPVDLQAVGGGQQLRKEAADSLALMQQQTNSLAPASGFRSYATQKTLYDQYVKDMGEAEADRVSARPGYSEHQTGLTMDFGPIDLPFANTPAHKWLTENGHKYGWVLRYPEGKESITGYTYEPWHWRYLGVVEATKFHDSSFATLEEFYGVEGGGYATDPVDPNPTPDPIEPTPDYDVNFIVRFFNALVKFITEFFKKK